MDCGGSRSCFFTRIDCVAGKGAARAEAVNLTAEDMALLPKISRRSFVLVWLQMKRRAKILRKISAACLLSPKRRALKASVTNPKLNGNSNLVRAIVIAEIFLRRREGTAGAPTVSEQEVEDFFKQPATQRSLISLLPTPKQRIRKCQRPDYRRTNEAGSQSTRTGVDRRDEGYCGRRRQDSAQCSCRSRWSRHASWLRHMRRNNWLKR